MRAITESSVSAINRVQRKTAELGFYLFSKYSVVKDFDIWGKTKVHLVRQCPAFEVCGQQQHKARPAKSLGSCAWAQNPRAEGWPSQAPVAMAQRVVQEPSFWSTCTQPMDDRGVYEKYGCHRHITFLAHKISQASEFCIFSQFPFAVLGCFVLFMANSASL